MTKKIDFESQILALFDSSPLIQNSKFNDFLWVCWFLRKILSNFVTPAWKLHNLYCHSVDRSIRPDVVSRMVEYVQTHPGIFLRKGHFSCRAAIINYFTPFNHCTGPSVFKVKNFVKTGLMVKIWGVFSHQLFCPFLLLKISLRLRNIWRFTDPFLKESVYLFERKYLSHLDFQTTYILHTASWWT